MSPKKTKPGPEGYLIRGATGDLHFIPKSEMKKYRLTPAKVADAKKLLDEAGVVAKKNYVPGFHGKDLIFPEGPIILVHTKRLKSILKTLRKKRS